jgi:DnaJ family protein B protein 4
MSGEPAAPARAPRPARVHPPSPAAGAGAAGDQRPGTAPADVVFVIKEKPHALFRREKDDLVCTLRVPLVDALCDGRRALTTLDGRELRVPASGAASAPAEWVVAGEGMPISKVRGGSARARAAVPAARRVTRGGDGAGAQAPGRRGDLRVRFEVVWPKALTAEQKATLRRVLPPG